jgi:uncharacterized SAM-binding protein YcdF (DUF218 family)
MTNREKFAAILSTNPLMRGEVIVVLCGQDEEERAAVALELFSKKAGLMVVLSGHTAKTLAPKVFSLGVSPANIYIEDESTNTREQAVNIVRKAIEHDWRRILLVASPYHTVRAYLTFLKALMEAGKQRDIHLVIVPASQLSWFGKPKGSDLTRAELLDVEMEKIERYGDHVASFEDGLNYLQMWEIP